MRQRSTAATSIQRTSRSKSFQPLFRIGRSIPFPLIRPFVSLVTNVSEAIDRNRFEYEWNGRSFVFEYTDANSFIYLFRAIQGGKTRHEGIPLSDFDFDTDYDAMIDIGAHFGTYSVILGVLNPSIPVLAFEPNTANARVCRRNIERNDIDGIVHEMAVTDRDGSIDFFEHSSAHNVHTTVAESTDDMYSTSTVETAALSSIFDKYDISDAFLKIDVEGAEEDIIRDLIEQAEYGRISGCLELHPKRMSADWHSVLDALSSAGFEYTLCNNIGESRRYWFSNFQPMTLESSPQISRS